jgi:hypothetical protein
MLYSVKPNVSSTYPMDRILEEGYNKLGTWKK